MYVQYIPLLYLWRWRLIKGRRVQPPPLGLCASRIYLGVDDDLSEDGWGGLAWDKYVYPIQYVFTYIGLVQIAHANPRGHCHVTRKSRRMGAKMPNFVHSAQALTSDAASWPPALHLLNGIMWSCELQTVSTPPRELE
jgi:hypothetical protein